MDSFDDLPMPLLPPLHLPGDAELAAAVRATPMAARFLDQSAPAELAARTGLDTPDGEVEVLRDGSAEEVLRLWSEVCFVAVHPAELGSQEEAVTLTELFLSGEPRPVEAGILDELGLVAEAAGGASELTPLGKWVARRVFASITGQQVPVFGSLAGKDAATLLQGLRSYAEDERREELAGWLSGRDRAKAAEEIAAAAAGASPLGRTVALQVLDAELGDDGREALRGLLATPRVGALVAARLGAERESSAEEIAWVLVDMAASLLEYGGDSEQVVEAMAMGMAPEEQAESIAILAFGRHPDTEKVLLTLVERHPDPKVAAAARKALRRHRGLADG
ncbi:hypothetical protein [Nonomuraea soli]|uniref:Uncharacterized protein n=1 Tax=Nonomuraea soli TaxID=1032476 RepID=A0A7W0CS07_9ACTN|nr:hypothetical protein [Nonomuraea soli]MBA2896205.1 hypothetical protein [Nonomuraea soli]